jgi:hypothetical protein
MRKWSKWWSWAAPSSTQRTSQNAVSPQRHLAALPLWKTKVCNSIQGWMFSTMLRSSWLDLVQLPPTAVPDGFYHIKRAFLKEATDLLSPDSYVSRDMDCQWASASYWWAVRRPGRRAFRVESEGGHDTNAGKKPRTRSYLAKWELWITVQVWPQLFPSDANNQSPILLYWKERVSSMFLGRSL